MRKNFTQLFMAFAFLVGFSTMSTAQCEIDPPPGAYYNFQFEGGLGDWRSLDAAGFETTLGWNWNETGDLTEGSFLGATQLSNIESESVCNGAAVMNGDFLDNGGMGVDFIGLGPCPADCNGYLVSPPMDLSGATGEVEVQFTQALRNFNSDYFIYVSVDGGASNRDTIRINDGNDGIAMFSFVNNVRNVALCGVGGESNVVLTFHYVANYYFWAIDDVSILDASTTPDMRVNNNFYSKAAGNYVTPASMVTESAVLADIENLRPLENVGSKLNFNVRNSAGETVYSDSRDYDPVPGCSTDENKQFDSNFMLPSEIGEYTIEFEIESAEEDVNPANDIVSAPFRISDLEFRKLPTQEEFGSEYLTGVRYGGSFVSWGAYFYIPQNDDELAIGSISLGIIANAGVNPSPGFIDVGVYQWIDVDGNGDADEGERILLGEGSILIEPNSPDFMEFVVTPVDENGEMIVPEAGAELLIVASTNPFDAVTNYFFNCAPSSGFEQFANGATQLGHRQAGLIGGYSSFASQDGASHDDRHDRVIFNIDGFATSYTYDIGMMLMDVSNTEEINENLGIKLFPTLASNDVFVDLNLAEFSEKVSLEIMDVSGNKINTYNFSNIKNDRLSVDVSTLNSGMYLMNIRTEAGMTSKKFSVIH